MATISGTSAIKNNAQLTCTYSLTVTAGTQSVTGNYTPINYEYYVLYDTASVQFVGTTRPNAGTVNVVINGTTVASKVVPLTNGITDGTYIIAKTSGTVNVPHNADGTKSLSYSISIASGTDQNNYNYVWNASSKSGSMTLTTIPRTSSFSLSGGDYLGQAVGVTISRASTSFTHTVQYSFGSSGWLTAATGVATYHEFAAATTLGWASYIPSAPSGTLSIKVTTYSGSTAIGSATASKTLYVSSQQSAHKPTFGTITATPVSDTVPSSWGLYVSGHSKVKVTISGSAGVYGSSIKSYSIYGAGLNVSSSSGTSGILITNKSAGSDEIYVGTVTDSRGQSSSGSTTIHVVPYSPPSVSVTAVRCESDGTESANGTYLKVTATYSCASVSGKNSITSRSVTCNSKSNTTFTSGTSFILSADCAIGSTYELTATVTDALGGTAIATITIPTATRVLNVKANKKGIAFGKFSETDNLVETGWPVQITSSDAKTLVKSGGLELYGGTPYMDFHYGNSTDDYTHRIIAGSAENLTITSNLNVAKAFSSTGITNYGTMHVDGYTCLANTQNVVGYHRFSDGYIGCYGSTTNAANSASRKGWFGFASASNTTLSMQNETGSAISFVYNSGNDYIQMVTDGSYEGFSTSSSWLRAPSAGLLPSSAVSGGTGQLGSAYGWYWAHSYITHMHGTDIDCSGDGSTLGAVLMYGPGTSAWIGFYDSNAYAAARNSSYRKGWFGFDSGSVNFYFANNKGGYIGGNKAWSNMSDKRLKEDIKDLPDVYVDIWQELQPKMFKWNELNSPDGKFHFGLIAQDVMATFEKYGLDYRDYAFIANFTIEHDGEEYFALTYDHYHMMTAAVVKKQQTEIDTLKSEVSELKNLIQELLNK